MLSLRIAIHFATQALTLPWAAGCVNGQKYLFSCSSNKGEQMSPGDVNHATVICVSELFNLNLCSALM